jgi:hypothetical protein
VTAAAAGAPIPGPAAKLISCILPDDGRELRLLQWLRDQQGVTRANSVYCRGHSILRQATARRGKLPEPTLVRLVTIVVDADQADALFDLIYAQADMHRPGGGSLIMAPLTCTTAFELPQGLADERRAADHG